MPCLIETTDLTFTGLPHPWISGHQSAIDAWWADARRSNPRLWNGATVLFRDARVEDGVLRAEGFAADFASFLYWRDNGRDPAVTHITGTSLPVTADGALLAVRMAAHTANPGQVYFPGGSFDTVDDLVGGRLDVPANVVREMAEETGIDARRHGLQTPLIAVFDAGAWHVALRIRLSLTFAECVDAMRAHQAATGDDELDGALAIRGLDDAERLKPYSRMLAEWHFRECANGP